MTCEESVPPGGTLASSLVGARTVRRYILLSPSPDRGERRVVPTNRGSVPSTRGRAARATMLTAAASAVLAAGVAPVAAQPGSEAGQSAAERVDELFAEAERAVEAYNGVDERVTGLRAEVERRQDRLARTQERVNEQRHSLGSFAAAHYRSGGVEPSLALLLADDPDSYLAQAAFLDRAGARQRDDLRGLLSAQRSMDQQRAEAGGVLAELESRRAELAERKREVKEKLALAQRQLNRLSERERAQRERAQRSQERE
uniref:coiled-coil domain-containing protein n=1 Tax=Streptomyces sp. SM14 TaxID=1736045 RepID=UPI0035BBBD4A